MFQVGGRGLPPITGSGTVEDRPRKERHPFLRDDALLSESCVMVECG